MLTFVFRRVLIMVPTLAVVSLAAFFIIQLPPGDFLTVMVAQMQASGDEMSMEVVDQWRTRYGLDQPIYVQYWRWISGVVHGDFGQSFIYDQPVGNTLSLITSLHWWDSLASPHPHSHWRWSSCTLPTATWTSV